MPAAAAPASTTCSSRTARGRSASARSTACSPPGPSSWSAPTPGARCRSRCCCASAARTCAAPTRSRCSTPRSAAASPATRADRKTPDQTHPFHVSGPCSRVPQPELSSAVSICHSFEEGLTVYQQNYDPFGNVFLSTVVAAVPIVVLLYFIALHPHYDKQGQRHLGISAPYAALCGVVAAFLVSCLAFHMPIGSAVSAFALGGLDGFMRIIWIVVAGMLLYTMTVVTGKFEIVKESIIHISFDRRLQVLLIAFSFGAIIEGTSGFGTPVAIAGAVMVGLGFSPFQSAVLNLLANTAPVAWGAIGTPIVTLAAVSGLDQLKLSAMAGNQLPFCSVLVPFWLVATFVKMEKGSWKEVFEVWPATLCCGATFAGMQWFASRTE